MAALLLPGAVAAGPPLSTVPLAAARRALDELRPRAALEAANPLAADESVSVRCEALSLRAGAKLELGDAQGASSDWRLAADLLRGTGEQGQIRRVDALGRAGLTLLVPDPAVGRSLLNATLSELAAATPSLEAADTMHSLALACRRMFDLGGRGRAYAVVFAQRAADLTRKSRPAPSIHVQRLLSLTDILMESDRLDDARELINEARELVSKHHLPALDLARCDGAAGSLAHYYHLHSATVIQIGRYLETPDTLPLTAARLRQHHQMVRSVRDTHGPDAVGIHRQRLLAAMERAGRQPENLPWLFELIPNLAMEQDNTGLYQDYAEWLDALALRLPSDSLARAISRLLQARLAGVRGDLEATGIHADAALRDLLQLAPSAYYTGEAHFLRGISRIQRAGGLTAAAIQGTAQTRLDRSLLEAGARDAEAALAIAQRLAPGTRYEAWARCLMAMVHLNNNDPAKAMEHAQAAYAVYDEREPAGEVKGYLLAAQGYIARRLGDQAAFARYLAQALPLIGLSAPNRLEKLMPLGIVGNLAPPSTNLIENELRAASAWSTLCDQYDREKGDEAKQALASLHFGPIIANLVDARLALGRTEAAFMALEDGRGRGLRDLLLSRSRFTSGIPAATRDEYSRALAERARAVQAATTALAARDAAVARHAAAVESKATPERIASLEQSRLAAQSVAEQTGQALITARLRLEALWSRITRDSPSLPARKYEIEDIRRSLPPGSLVLAYCLGADRSSLLVLGSADHPQADLKAFPLAAGRTQLAGLAAAFRRSVTRPDTPLQEVLSAGRELVAAILPPGVHSRLRAAKRLIVSPDGPLWDVPFAALPEPVDPPAGTPSSGAVAPEGFLGLRTSLCYTQSLAAFVENRRSRQAPNGRQRVLIVGDPAFGPPRAGELPLAPLPGSRVEARQVAALYGVPPLLGVAATEAAVRRTAPGADVIHLATHVQWVSQPALGSTVLLSPGPRRSDSADDGRLLAAEVFDQLRLNAGLVVLSACESGRGKQVPGEGVIGLTRAMFSAGAKGVVASQWRVPDAPTADLMVEFHRRLKSGQDRDRALLLAAERVAKRKETRHPYFWASFFLVGSPT